MKLWQKDTDSSAEVSRFTVGRDREMDLYLARFDVLGSLAHIRMLETVGLLTTAERKSLTTALQSVYRDIEKGAFAIEDGVEDIHSQVELLLTRSLGDAGKKIHSGRSRNDQVLLDVKLYLRSEIEALTTRIKALFDILLAKSEEHSAKLLPGYTHLQLAMPSSFGLWFGAYAESLADDLGPLEAAYRIVNKNPLGSAAGYGSSFPLDRRLTTELMGFEDLNYNVVYAQMGRGKAERIVAASLSNVAATLARFAMDVCLYLNQNFGFISFPDELTTGSSIMPHKKNPDVFELIRAKCNALQSLPNEIMLITTNLPSGYHRDLQLLKEKLFPAFTTLSDCLSMAVFMLGKIEVKENLLDDEKYKYLFSVEEVNALVRAGMPFRDAYKQVGKSIADGTFKVSREVDHTHIGSIGNPAREEIRGVFNQAMARFHFEIPTAALRKLVSE